MEDGFKRYFVVPEGFSEGVFRSVRKVSGMPFSPQKYIKNDRPFRVGRMIFMVHPGKTEGYRTFPEENRLPPGEKFPGISGSRS